MPCQLAFQVKQANFSEYARVFFCFIDVISGFVPFPFFFSSYLLCLSFSLFIPLHSFSLTYSHCHSFSSSLPIPPFPSLPPLLLSPSYSIILFLPLPSSLSLRFPLSFHFPSFSFSLSHPLPFRIDSMFLVLDRDEFYFFHFLDFII